VALELSDSEFAVYICSKEGFIKKHGWERALLKHMRSNPGDVIAGHHSHMPKFIYGREYQKHPEFSKFRNPDFALDNPNRRFAHVQGGVFIMRRDFVKDHGGFNPATPHGGMDVEMSYYIESMGGGLGVIPEVASLTVKTRPTLTAIVDERTVIAHPLTVTSVVTDLDAITKDKGQCCNLCGWQGKTFTAENKKDQQIQVCPECLSSDFGRSIMKLLANNHHIYRGEKCFVLSDDKSLKAMLEKLFKVVLVSDKDDDFLKGVKASKDEVDCFIVDPELMADSKMTSIWKTMIEKLSIDGEIIFADKYFKDELNVSDASKSTQPVLQEIFANTDERFSIEYRDFARFCVAVDWRRFAHIRRVGA
jgi:hypothetical protein